ncbi:hypothetical protein BDV18DRAFT_141394 [Aspergillus unguis]
MLAKPRTQGLHLIEMRDFWRPPWMGSKASLGDDQRDHLLPKTRDVHQTPARATPLPTVKPQERYVGFGIGGAGNIRKSDYLSLSPLLRDGVDME